MNAPKHTAAPWRAAWSMAGCWLVYIGDRMLTLQGAESKADACLIAAAPDLLEVLQWVAKTHSMCASERARVNAAIAQATGSAL